MELAGNILALALLMLHGALVLGAQAARLSVAAALRVIRRTIEALRHQSSTFGWRQMFREALKDDYHRRRPKRARAWPHKKNQAPPGPPRLRRPGRHERSRMEALFVENRLDL